MHPDVSALLAVQADDVAIYGLESKMAELLPRIEAMAKERQRATQAVTDARQTALAEERRRGEVAARVAEHRALQEKNQAALNNVTSMREATAATAQLEQSKRMIDEDERELTQIGHRLVEANRTLQEREQVAAQLAEEQERASATLTADRAQLEQQIGDQRKVRDEKARAVPRSLLSRYDRIRSRHRAQAIFALRGNSCGHCDTRIPLQRRSVMAGTGATEICEACGVMLYAVD